MGATYFVAPDGSGDYPNIQSAVVAAQHGDVIELGEGIFRGTGNRDVDFLNKRITIRSRSMNPGLCVINCEGGPGNYHFGFVFNSGCTAETVLEGVTVMHAYDDWGGGLEVFGGSPRIRRCILTENVSTGEGGGLHVWGGAPVAEDCWFIENTAEYGGGAAASTGYSDVATFVRCTFRGNHATAEGGGVRY